MKKKIEDLTPEDFPELNPVKFEEWKKLRVQTNRNVIIFFACFLLINIIIFIAFGAIWFGGLLLILILYFISQKVNKLTKELGLNPKRINQALLEKSKTSSNV
jgi:hypothetical protein